jgi:outer membrane protein
MKKIISLIWLSILSMSFFSTYAQDNQTVFTNVDEVIKLALKNNPELSVYLLQQEKATVDYKKNKNYFLPNISGTASFQNNLALQTTALPGEIFGQPGESVNVQIGQQYNYNAGINLSKTIFDRELTLKAKVSKISTNIAIAQTEIYKQGLKEQAAFYYYSALIGKQAVKISKEDLKISDSIYQLTDQKFKEGIINVTVKNQAIINRNKIEQSLLTNQNIYNKSLNSLKLLLGVDFETQLTLTENIIENESILEKLNLKEDKKLVLKTLQEEQSKLSIKQEKSAFLPKLTLNGYFGKQQLSNQIGVSFNNNTWNDFSYIGASLNMPIFSGFSKKNKVEIAKIDNEISLQNLQIEKENSASKDAELLAEYEQNIYILKSSKDNFLLTKQNTDLTMLKYQQGLINLDSYFNSYEDYLKAESNYLNTLFVTFTQYATILSRQQL